MLALFANGTVELLSSRSILKREVKAHMTMLLDRENNPLKLLPDGGAVLRQMFGLPLPGFMSPQSAVSDAFQDLHAHQIGMVAGMRAALMDLLTRFSPQRLRERDDAMRWYEKRVPVLYKARMWDRYAATHRDTVFAIEDDFASVFGRRFWRRTTPKWKAIAAAAGIERRTARPPSVAGGACRRWCQVPVSCEATLFRPVSSRGTALRRPP